MIIKVAGWYNDDKKSGLYIHEGSDKTSYVIPANEKQIRDLHLFGFLNHDAAAHDSVNLFHQLLGKKHVEKKKQEWLSKNPKAEWEHKNIGKFSVLTIPPEGLEFAVTEFSDKFK